MSTRIEAAPDSTLGIVQLGELARIHPEDLETLRAQEAIHAELSATLEEDAA
jgi:hypothetical protein